MSVLSTIKYVKLDRVAPFWYNVDTMDNNMTRKKIKSYFENKKLQKHNVKRIWEIDFLRGLTILIIVIDHTFMMLSYYFIPAWYGNIITATTAGERFCKFAQTLFFSDGREYLRLVFLIILFAICGISCSFSKNNLLRTFKLAMVSLAITIATYIAEYKCGVNGCFTTFGPLHFLTLCLFIWSFICLITNNKPLLRLPISFTLSVTILLIYHLCPASTSTPSWLYFMLPRVTAAGKYILFYPISLSPGDIMPFIPWAAFFFYGTLIAPFMYPEKKTLLPRLDRAWNKPLCFLGRHSLIIYLLQTLVVGSILLIVSIARFKINPFL